MTSLRKLLHKVKPSSLFGQILWLITFGFVLLEISNFAVVCSVQWLYVEQAEKNRAEQLASYRALFDAIAPAERLKAVEKLQKLGRAEGAREKITLPSEPPRWSAPSGRLLRQVNRLRDIYRLSDVAEPEIRAHSPGYEESLLFPLYLPALEIACTLSDGTWLQISIPYSTDDRAVVWSQRIGIFAAGLLLLFVTALMLSRVIKPMRELSEVVSSFGLHPENAAPVEENGVEELRILARAFNRMRARIQGNLAERNRMIGALAHDLRTPLTKITLRLNRVQPEALREQLANTVSGMNGIITQGLEFARSLNTEEKPVRLELNSFMTSIVDDLIDIGRPVVMTACADDAPIIVDARPVCLRRCIENLLSNALSYGTAASVTLTADRGAALVTISDNGPGIPEEMLEAVFEPYTRVDPSRNANSGGLGLGLAIARNMALLNNAELTLANRPKGGLAATLRIPCKRP